MKILLTNDDGVYADGLNKLANNLKAKYDVLIVAPDRERSAIGHAITLHKPLRLNNIHKEKNLEIYHVNGTPSDCVKLGIDVISKDIDIIISGINNGFNLGTDILYSGTVSAALEASINGYPSIAISLESGANLNNKEIYTFIESLIENIKNNGMPIHSFLNINLPKVESGYKGIRITTLGSRSYKENFTKRIDPRGKEYYWLAGRISEDVNNDDSDIVAVNNGFISITPVHFDLTKYDLIKILKKWEITF